MSDADQPLEDEELERIVRAHRVVHRVEPARTIVDGEPRTIGFDVVLCGVHDAALQALSPGCEACGHLWQEMAKVATAALPPLKESTLQIQPFRPLLHYDAHGSGEATVELTIEIRHVSGYEMPLNGCENDCMHVLVANLKRLGVAASG